MKKKLSVILSVLCCMAMLFSLTACNNNFIDAQKQLDILRELRANTADIGIMDAVMANYYVNISDDLAVIENFKFSEEKYGIGFRQGSKGMSDKVNTALSDMYASGEVLRLAQKYKVSEAMIPIVYESKWDNLTASDKADYEMIMKKGEIILGYTVFAPIAYEIDGKLAGFDIELAEAVFAKMGLKVKTQVITWTNKATELKTSAIDCIWNGMTITEELLKQMEISTPYLKNSQVALIRKSDVGIYTNDYATFINAKIIAEGGSTGYAVCEKIILPAIKKLK